MDNGLLEHLTGGLRKMEDIPGLLLGKAMRHVLIARGEIMFRKIQCKSILVKSTRSPYQVV